MLEGTDGPWKVPKTHISEDKIAEQELYLSTFCENSAILWDW